MRKYASFLTVLAVAAAPYRHRGRDKDYWSVEDPDQLYGPLRAEPFEALGVACKRTAVRLTRATATIGVHLSLHVPHHAVLCATITHYIIERVLFRYISPLPEAPPGPRSVIKDLKAVRRAVAADLKREKNE